MPLPLIVPALVIGGALVGAVALAGGSSGGGSGPRPSPGPPTKHQLTPDEYRAFGQAMGWPPLMIEFGLAAAWRESHLQPGVVLGTKLPPSSSEFAGVIPTPYLSKSAGSIGGKAAAAAMKSYERNADRFGACGVPVGDYAAGAFGLHQILPAVGMFNAFADTFWECMNPLALLLPSVNMAAMYAQAARLQRRDSYDGTAGSLRLGFASNATMDNPGGDKAKSNRAAFIASIKASGAKISPDSKMPSLSLDRGDYVVMVETTTGLGAPAPVVGDTRPTDPLATLAAERLDPDGETPPPRPELVMVVGDVPELDETEEEPKHLAASGERWWAILDRLPDGRYTATITWEIWQSQNSRNPQYRSDGEVKLATTVRSFENWSAAEPWWFSITQPIGSELDRYGLITQDRIVNPWPPARSGPFNCRKGNLPGADVAKNLACGLWNSQRPQLRLNVSRASVPGWYLVTWPWGPLAASKGDYRIAEQQAKAIVDRINAGQPDP